MEIYKANSYNVALVQELLQHSSTVVTQRYIGIHQKELEAAREKHLYLDIYIGANPTPDSSTAPGIHPGLYCC